MAERHTSPTSGTNMHTFKRIRIFIGEAQQWQGKPLYRAILELVQREGAVGATVMRAIEGFGPAHHLSSERLPDISDNLPLVIECVERLLPLLDHIVQRGMITVAPVEVVYSRSA